MKTLLYLGIILMLGSCSNESESATPNESTVNVNGREVSTVKIGSLEVMTEDLGEMNWDDAMKACTDLGDGWRLPTKDELQILYEDKVQFGGFANNFYWSSTESGYDYAWIQYFGQGHQSTSHKFNHTYVCAVRGSYEEGTVEISTNSLSTKTVKIGSLEVMTEDLGEMNWDDAMKACTDLGDGWRLPTKDELQILYENKDELGGFANDNYWSSTEFDNVNAWQQYFDGRLQLKIDKNYDFYVRAIRSF